MNGGRSVHAFLGELDKKLGLLTFNNGKAIRMLTGIADKYSQLAPQISRCILRRLASVSGGAKLATLYLVDSICKNTQGGPRGTYPGLFEPHIAQHFLDLYRSAPAQRPRLLRLLGTWENDAMFTGPSAAIRAQTQTRTQSLPQKRRAQTAAPMPPAAKRRGVPVVAAIRRMLTVLEDRLRTRPDLVGYLGRVREDLRRKLSIESTIRELTDAIEKPPQPQLANPADLLSFLDSAVESPKAAPPAPTGGFQSRPRGQPTAIRNPVVAPPVLAPPVLVPPPRVVSSRPEDKSPPVPDPKLPHLVDVSAVTALFRRDWLKQRHNTVIYSLYEGRGNICESCGMRMPTPEAMSAHLTSHFRQNKLNGLLLGRARSRNWYQPAKDWHATESALQLREAMAKRAGDGPEGGADDEAAAPKPDLKTRAGDGETGVCAKCGDALEKQYDADTDGYVFVRATRGTQEQPGVVAAGLQGKLICQSCVELLADRTSASGGK